MIQLTNINNVWVLCKRLLQNTNAALFIQHQLIHNNTIIRQRIQHTYKESQIGNSLWFTNLPQKKRNIVRFKRKKPISGPIPQGVLVIKCKNKKFDHYSGMHYKKFDVIPLASKGWHHRKSKGDYFTILPTSEHPAFILSSGESVPLTFEEIGVNNEILAQLKKTGISFPTNIQAKAMPLLLKGEKVLMTAETGCGKTHAYLAPMVQQIMETKSQVQSSEPNSPYGIIILPTRELALQVGMVAQRLCSGLGLKCVTLIGGHTKQILLNPQLEPVDILVCTIGVINKAMNHNLYSFENCKHVVVDEADTLFDDSFSNSLKRFFRKSKLSFIPLGETTQQDGFVDKTAQICLSSATKPTSLSSILEGVVSLDSLHIVSTVYLHKIQPHIPQIFKRLGKSQRPEELLKLVKRNSKEKKPTMIFSNKASTCNWIHIFLNESGINSARINGEMTPEERLKCYENYRCGRVDFISCTDIGSRGINCTRTKCVINYEFPKFIADYIHRCGRTGRILHDENCFVVNFISSRAELNLLHEIEKAARSHKELDNVNNNINRIIKYRIMKNSEAT